MNFLSLIVLVASAGVLVTGQTPNYCALTSCGSNPHVACGHTGTFATTCPAGARMLDLTPHISTILDWHNTKRNSIASGSVSPFLPAKRMATMEWNNELASLAALNVMQCKMNHDKCRNTAFYNNAGQNLATAMYTGPESGFSDSWLIDYMMQGWWNENVDTTMPQIDSYPASSPAKVIGHFTAMIGERQNAIGCACSRWFDPVTKNNNLVMACNMASTNIVGWPTYQSGPSASACTSGTNPLYKSLCSTSETGYNW